METATIYFADGSSIIAKEGDTVIAITKHTDENQNTFATKKKPIQLSVSIHNGVIADLLDVFSDCSFFCIGNEDTIYNVSSIVKIE